MRRGHALTVLAALGGLVLFGYAVRRVGVRRDRRRRPPGRLGPPAHPRTRRRALSHSRVCLAAVHAAGTAGSRSARRSPPSSPATPSATSRRSAWSPASPPRSFSRGIGWPRASRSRRSRPTTCSTRRRSPRWLALGVVVALLTVPLSRGVARRRDRGARRRRRRRCSSRSGCCGARGARKAAPRPAWRERLAGLRRSVLAFSTDQPGRLLQVFAAGPVLSRRWRCSRSS